MNTRSANAALAAIAAVSAAALILAWGPLDPPPGPPQPTMHTLDEIYEEITQTPGVQVWDYLRAIPPADGKYEKVITGSGILHAIIRPKNNENTYFVRDGDGTLIMELYDEEKFELDIRYHDGLEIRRSGNYATGPLMFLYLPDPG